MREAARIAGMNPTDQEVEEWWNAADANGDGSISLEEYVNIMASNYVTIDLEQERMQTAFKVIDKNGDGKISLQEFKTVMMFNDMFTKEEVNKLFKEVDSDDKGYIDYKDFVKNRMYEVLF
uniref:Calmodulin-like n=1 Tax=Crassostrea virginica TaxID=6565 RepID=A0A8B8C0H3_CRAVI|nr:calmodulin-like [Crassostrea virginica]